MKITTTVGLSRATLVPLLLAVGSLAACVTQPPAPPPPPAAMAAPPGPDTQIYVYPRQGQSDQQLDRDRYECHMWAVKQTGFDPSAPSVPPHDRYVVVREPGVGPPQGAAVAAGAFTGAILGAAVSRPRDAGLGAIVGALAGGALGAAASQDSRPPTERVVETPAGRNLERSAANYRRAIGACLDARGYTVK